MFQRGISTDEVTEAVRFGETIEVYPDDAPYPSRLIKGVGAERTLHVVVSDNTKDEELIIITVYEPDPKLWEMDFVRRKKR